MQQISIHKTQLDLQFIRFLWSVQIDAGLFPTTSLELFGRFVCLWLCVRVFFVRSIQRKQTYIRFDNIWLNGFRRWGRPTAPQT
jgi:hypothetical protein